MSKWFYDTSTDTATWETYCGSLLEILRLSYARARWTQEFTWFRPSECNTLYPRKKVVLLCVRCCLRLSWVCPLLSPARSFYSLKLGSYTRPWGPTSGPRVVESLYSRALPARRSKWWLQRHGVRHVLSSYHVAHSPRYGTVLSGRLAL
jgi:hypothetical protein